MTDKITEDMIDKIADLSNLELTLEEKEIAKKDIENMIGFINKIYELDTKNEEVTHSYTDNNIFREDVITSEESNMVNAVDDIINDAPDKKNRHFKVPKTI